MAIAFKSSGAGAGTETNAAALNLVCPAVVAANDILVAHVMHTGITTNPTTPSGWTLLYPDPADITVGAPVGTGTALARHWAFGKLAVGTEDGTTVSFGTGGGTNGRAGRIYSFDGYVSGTITDVIPFASFTDDPTETDPNGPTVTTTVAGAKAVALMCQDDDNTHTDITGESGGSWANFLEFVSSTLGPQGLVMTFMVGTPTVDPGTISGGVLAGTNDESGTIGFEIRPSVPIAPVTGSGSPTASLTATAAGTAVETFIGSGAPIASLGATAAGEATHTADEPQNVEASGAPIASLGATAAGAARETFRGSGAPIASQLASAAGTAVETFLASGDATADLNPSAAGSATETFLAEGSPTASLEPSADGTAVHTEAGSVNASGAATALLAPTAEGVADCTPDVAPPRRVRGGRVILIDEKTEEKVELPSKSVEISVPVADPLPEVSEKVPRISDTRRMDPAQWKAIVALDVAQHEVVQQEADEDEEDLLQVLMFL